ncbi:MAG: 50S ribosomal protein L3 [Clostridia bacterium]|nr:50S ribosomal protein L3 [Clostridia bacterium]MCR5690411.1 50S ribosomal protein L3 [Clostridiales bacterium]
MKKAIMGKKIAMTQLFGEKGKVIPVTIIEAGPDMVIRVKTGEKDGYDAVQLGYGDVKLTRLNKPMTGYFKAQGTAPKKYLREFRFDDCSAFAVGDVIKASTFAVGDKVDVSGVSKGKGTAGTIKRWNHARLKETHGSGPVARHGGSLGACSDPSRVYKGRKMAGHLGVEAVTIQNLEIAAVDDEHDLIAVKGAVPGPRGGLVIIRDAVKKA